MNYSDPMFPHAVVWYDALEVCYSEGLPSRTDVIHHRFDLGQTEFDLWCLNPSRHWDIHIQNHEEYAHLVQARIYPVVDGEADTQAEALVLPVVIRTTESKRRPGWKPLGRQYVRPYDGNGMTEPSKLLYEFSWRVDDTGTTLVRSEIPGGDGVDVRISKLHQARVAVLDGTAHPAVVTAYALYLENKLTTARESLS